MGWAQLFSTLAKTLPCKGCIQLWYWGTRTDSTVQQGESCTCFAIVDRSHWCYATCSLHQSTSFELSGLRRLARTHYTVTLGPQSQQHGPSELSVTVQMVPCELVTQQQCCRNLKLQWNATVELLEQRWLSWYWWKGKFTVPAVRWTNTVFNCSDTSCQLDGRTT